MAFSSAAEDGGGKESKVEKGAKSVQVNDLSCAALNHQNLQGTQLNFGLPGWEARSA